MPRNTKTHSANTDHRLAGSPNRPIFFRDKFIGTYLSLALLVAALSGCVSGNATEQRRVETQEATRGAELDAIQATSVAERFRPGTPDPQPTWTPKASISELVLATNINSDSSPNGDTTFVSAGQTVYVCARVSRVREGQTLIAVWRTIDGAEVDRTEFDIDAGSSTRWIALRWQASGSGMFSVSIYIDEADLEHLIDPLVFRVG